MKIGYVRVSTIEQNEARQIEAKLMVLKKFIWTKNPGKILIVQSIRK